MFPVVSNPLNFGFCLDNLNFEFIESIILKPILCLLLTLFGPGFPSPTNKSINYYFFSAGFFSACGFLSPPASFCFSSFLAASPSLPCSALTSEPSV